MKRILLRAGKGPFDVVSAEASLSENTIRTNSGNLVFSHTVHKLLSVPDVEVVPNVKESMPPDADRINEEFDVFVIPLANAFRLTFRSILNRFSTLIERLNIPVVVFGLGAQTDLDYNLAEMAPIDDAVKRFTKAVLDKSPSIGVRGELTADYLKALGFKDNDIDIIGCPSMFLHGDQLHVRKKVPSLGPDARLAVNASPNDLVTKKMGAIIASHREKYEDFVYVPQNNNSLDLMLWGGAAEDLGKQGALPIYESHPLYRENKMRFFVDPWTWMDYLAERDFVFGTRIHGNITALIAGTPSVVIAHDSRTLELARYFDLPYRKITDVPDDIDARDLYEAADFSAMHSGQRKRFEVLLDFMAKHDLECSFGPAGGAEEFDERLRQVSFPGPVTPLTVENAKDRLRSLRDSARTLRREVRTLDTRAERLEATRDKLTKTLDETRASKRELTKTVKSLSAANAKLTRRLEKAERDIAALRNTPYRRVRRRIGRVVRKVLPRGR